MRNPSELTIRANELLKKSEDNYILAVDVISDGFPYISSKADLLFAQQTILTIAQEAMKQAPASVFMAWKAAVIEVLNNL